MRVGDLLLEGLTQPSPTGRGKEESYFPTVNAFTNPQSPLAST